MILFLKNEGYVKLWAIDNNTLLVITLDEIYAT
jgi:hypothetical protein